MSLETDYIAAIQAGDEPLAARLALQIDPPHTPPPEDPWRLARAAIWYIEQHVPIFPIAPGGKRPLLPRRHTQQEPSCRGECGQLGHGLYDATLDPVQIRSWWMHTPQANLGMPTGRLYDVYDIDGFTGVASVWGSHPIGPFDCFRDTLTVLGHVSTPRPGGHHLYTAPAGRGNATALLPGVDYRGTGGYVLLPPSYIDTEDYTGEYQWLDRPEFRQ